MTFDTNFPMPVEKDNEYNAPDEIDENTNEILFSFERSNSAYTAGSYLEDLMELTGSKFRQIQYQRHHLHLRLHPFQLQRRRRVTTIAFRPAFRRSSLVARSKISTNMCRLAYPQSGHCLIFWPRLCQLRQMEGMKLEAQKVLDLMLL